MMNATSPFLMPSPREMIPGHGTVMVAPHGLIAASPQLLFEAKMVQQALADAGVQWDIVAGSQYELPLLRLSVDDTLIRPQGYELTIAPDRFEIRGADHAGVYYGVSTLRQLVQQYGAELPVLTIRDSPDFPARGVMLDISRDKVPTIGTLYQLCEQLASWKINQLQLYTEHTFAYRNHPDVWDQASPLTGQEIMELDAFCKRHHIELVPCQNSLGHMERWLKHEHYHDLAECPDGFVLPWGVESASTTLNALDPRSLELIRSLYAELLPHFTSRLVNVGGDEPWELGQCRSREAVEERGGRVYLEYLLALHDMVRQYDRRMQFWADIIIHYPDLIPEVPSDAIAMEWGYEANHDFEGHCRLLAQSGIPFYVCPGTSSWTSLSGRTDNAIGNLSSAAENGLTYGALGYLITDWGDAGHWQPLSISYLGSAYGAAVSWAYEKNLSLDVQCALDVHVFQDRAGVMGKLAFDLGNTYREIGPPLFNAHPLALILQATQSELVEVLRRFGLNKREDFTLQPNDLRDLKERIDEIIAPLETSSMQRRDAELVRAEFRQVANLLRHAIDWALLTSGEPTKSAQQLSDELDTLLAQQEENWLARNRPGGLADSLERFDKLHGEYARLQKSEDGEYSERL